MVSALSSRTPHGVRGLKSIASPTIITVSSRTPHGVRGLKLALDLADIQVVASHPSRGAWIEIPDGEASAWRTAGRTPHGVRGLKCSHPGARPSGVPPSHPSRGAWIEMRPTAAAQTMPGRRTPHGVRGLKWLARRRLAGYE